MQRDESLSENSEEIDEDSHASILASVREQEHQFAQLTKEIEKERQTVARQLNHDSYGNDMVGAFSGCAVCVTWNDCMCYNFHVSNQPHDLQIKTGSSVCCL